ncbi:MAG: hypothetical protein AAGF24_16005, partial [Cyanobacteria bacterium P01_H01_bin.121]
MDSLEEKSSHPNADSEALSGDVSHAFHLRECRAQERWLEPILRCTLLLSMAAHLPVALLKLPETPVPEVT